jgi:acetoin utilization deacetylase AcuC-like enzyme
MRAMTRGRPYARPIRQPLNGLHHPIEALGWYSHDNDAILSGTWGAARGAVDVTVSAWRAVADGSVHAAYALARPPGHHAAADSYAGYCFLNNAAIAAAEWAARGARVAILDVDYHHGNGTQQIFAARGDVCFVSLHADPAHEYPFFSGYADEHGVGAGEDCTHNFPLPLGTTWNAYAPALDAATDVIRQFGPDGWSSLLGVDTAAEDYDTFPPSSAPISRIGEDRCARAADRARAGGRLRPGVIGRNVVSVLRGVDDAYGSS